MQNTNVIFLEMYPMSSGSINKVILIGNLGKDPEIRATQNGKEMATFSIATSESWIDKLSGTRSEKTEWHNIIVFSDGLVRVVKDFARKGSKIYIEGSLRTREWTDQNGQKRYTTEVVLSSFNHTLTLLDSRSNAQSFDNKQYEPKQEEHNHENFSNNIENELADDEIPF